MPDQMQQTGALSRIDHGLCFADGESHRLFRHDMAARFERLYGQCRVGVRRRRDTDQPRPGFRDGLAKIGKCLGDAAPRRAVGQSSRIGSDQRDDLEAGSAHRWHMNQAAKAGAHHHGRNARNLGVHGVCSTRLLAMS